MNLNDELDLRMPKRVPQAHSWVVMSENGSGDEFLIADCDRFQDAVKYASMQNDPTYVRKMMIDPRTGVEYEEPFLYDTRVKFTNKAWNDKYVGV